MFYMFNLARYISITSLEHLNRANQFYDPLQQKSDLIDLQQKSDLIDR